MGQLMVDYRLEIIDRKWVSSRVKSISASPTPITMIQVAFESSLKILQLLYFAFFQI